MTDLASIARHLMAIMQPTTGERASGVVTVAATAGGSDVELPRSAYAIPVIAGRARSDLAIKVGDGPNANHSWTVTPAGVAVDFLSNLGGVRYHEITAGSTVIFDPPLDGIASAAVTTGFAGGIDATGWGAVKDIVEFEQLDNPDAMLDLARSEVKGFPAVLLAWMGSEPSDGSSVAHNVRATRRSSFEVEYRETFQVQVFSSRAESDRWRRSEGMAILDTITGMLTDRHMIDGVALSNPSGLQVRNRFRRSLATPDKYRVFYVYGLNVSVENVFCQSQVRTYADWLKAAVDVTIMDRNTPREDLPMVGDGQPGDPAMDINMRPTP